MSDTSDTSDTRPQKSTLTLDDVGDKLQVRADVLDLVQTGQGLDGDVLVAVHLRNEVQVVAEVLPVWTGHRQRDGVKDTARHDDHAEDHMVTSAQTRCAVSLPGETRLQNRPQLLSDLV